MRFLITKELKDNKLLKLLIISLVSFFILFLILDVLLHHYQIGLSISSATETILGNEENFIEPIIFDALLERVHIDIFISMILITLITLIYIRVDKKAYNILIHLLFISAIISQIILILSYYYGDLLVISWILLFLLWHLLAFYICFIILWKLTR